MATPQKGQNLTLENLHEERAIYLQNLMCQVQTSICNQGLTLQRVGKLPSMLSSWLSTLIKRGWLCIHASVPSYCHLHQMFVVLVIQALVLSTADVCNLSSLEQLAWQSLASKLNLPLVDVLPNWQSYHVSSRTSIPSIEREHSYPIHPASFTLPTTTFSKFHNSTSNFFNNNLLNNNNIVNFTNRPTDSILTKRKPQGPITMTLNLKKRKVETSPNHAVAQPVSEVPATIVLPTHDMPKTDALQALLEQLSDTSSALLPQYEPAPLLTITLRPYQKQALGWMLNREQSYDGVVDSTVSINFTKHLPAGWSEHVTTQGKKYYLNSKDNRTSWTFPFQAVNALETTDELKCCGGILADQVNILNFLFFALGCEFLTLTL